MCIYCTTNKAWNQKRHYLSLLSIYINHGLSCLCQPSRFQETKFSGLSLYKSTTDLLHMTVFKHATVYQSHCNTNSGHQFEYCSSKYLMQMHFMHVLVYRSLISLGMTSPMRVTIIKQKKKAREKDTWKIPK